MAVAEPEPKLWPKSEPEINNFGSATMFLILNLTHFASILYYIPVVTFTGVDQDPDWE